MRKLIGTPLTFVPVMKNKSLGNWKSGALTVSCPFIGAFADGKIGARSSTWYFFRGMFLCTWI
jgi:hypothetical protein